MRELESLVMERGLPRVIVSDNGCDLLVALGAPYAQQCGRVLYTQSERAEQRGFANIVKGVFGMFRNPPAHAPKIVWAVNREDAEEAFTLLSMIHKRIDAARTPARA